MAEEVPESFPPVSPRSYGSHLLFDRGRCSGHFGIVGTAERTRILAGTALSIAEVLASTILAAEG